MKRVPGPDFPTGGIIVGREGIESAYGTGKGRFVVRGMAHIEEGKGGRHEIIITEIPFQVNKSTLIERIAELVREDRIDQISDLRDEFGSARYEHCDRTQARRTTQKGPQPAI